MYAIIKKVYTPLLSLFIFVLGSGLFMTLLVLRMHEAKISALYIGAMTSAYYLGLVIGSFKIEKMILRVGHIRTFSAFASLLAVVCLLHGMLFNMPFWLLLRLVGGYATAAIFVVIESWLLVSGSLKIRGQVLSLYMITFYAAQAFGQFLVTLSTPQDLMLYALTAIFCSLSVIPLAMTKARQPQISEPSVLGFKKLFRKSASGVLGCFCAGLILSAIYGLLPLYIIDKAHSAKYVSTYMAAVIFGGMALQYPLGRLSDVIERRSVLIMITISVILVSALTLLVFSNNWLAVVVMFLLGGMTFTLYPISISHGCDSLQQKDIVSGTQGLLLAYSIGATVGPVLAPIFIRVSGTTNALFYYFMVICVFLLVFLSWRRVSTPSREQEEQFQSIPQTTPITAELDPRGED